MDTTEDFDQARKAFYRAGEEVKSAIARALSMFGSVATNIDLALNDKPHIVSQPEWPSHDALKVTVALANFNNAREYYGHHMRLLQTETGLTYDQIVAELKESA